MKGEANIYVCPTDRVQLLYMDAQKKEDENFLLCNKCSHKYAVVNNVPMFLNSMGENEKYQKEIYEARNELLTPYVGFLEYPFLINHFQRKKYIDFLDIKPGMRILEVGTQNGTHLRYLKSRFPFIPDQDFVGVDIAMEGLKIGSEHNQFRYTLASIYSLPFYDNFFDIVLLPGIVEHLAEPERAMKEISRVLKPDGQFTAYFVVKDYGFSFHWITNNLFKLKSFIRASTTDIGHDFDNVIKKYHEYETCFHDNELIFEKKIRVNILFAPIIDFIFLSFVGFSAKMYRLLMKKLNAQAYPAHEAICSGTVAIPTKEPAFNNRPSLRLRFIQALHFAMWPISKICLIEQFILGSNNGLSALVYGRKLKK